MGVIKIQEKNRKLERKEEIDLAITVKHVLILMETVLVYLFGHTDLVVFPINFKKYILITEEEKSVGNICKHTF